MIVGPRLDRPSAVGDEGRPRSAGLAGATVVVLGYAALLAETLGLWGPLQVIALGVSMTVAGVALVDRPDAAARVVGHLVLLPGGLIAVGGSVQAAIAGPGAGVLVACLGLAMFGVAAAWADAAGRGRLTTAIEGGAVSALVLLLAAILVFVVLGTAVLLQSVLVRTLLPGARPRLPGLLFVLWTSALALRVAIPRLPIAELAPRHRRPAVDAYTARLARLTAIVAVLGCGAWLVVGLGQLTRLLPRLVSVRSPLLVVIGAPVRVGLAGVASLVMVGAMLAVLATRVARLDPPTVRSLAPVAGGIGLLCIPVPVLTAIIAGIAADPRNGLVFAALALVLVFLGAVLVLLGFAGLAALAGLGFLPDRAAPLALVGIGLVGTSIGVGLAGGPSVAVILGVAAAMFAWDVSEVGLGITAELGHRPDTTRIELLHTVASAGIGVVAVGLGVGLSWLVWAVGAGADSLVPVAALAFGGSVALAVALRG